ncbi:MAG: deoxyribonuclease V [Gammaproteobacteria bacterium]|nr:deoxyribonuclease V [Gammaproteobacteria bacterium]MDH5730440.1 deoxyribonuclease V [Gammaproteobacteria bacterium]
MMIANLHSWDLLAKEAMQLQKNLAKKVIREDRFQSINTVAGVDVGFLEQGKTTRAAVAVLNFPALSLVEHRVVDVPTCYPYIPGLLSFRELPAVLSAISQLGKMPDLFLVDGQGIAHPRRLGIASHLGLWVNRPTVGVGKSRLLGSHGELPNKKGAWTPLLDQGEVVGAVLRSRVNVKPIYISIGHRCSLPTAIHWVLACITKYKLPETTRYAHYLASEYGR